MMGIAGDSYVADPRGDDTVQNGIDLLAAERSLGDRTTVNTGNHRVVPVKEAIRGALEKRHDGGHTVAQLEEETADRQTWVPKRHHLGPSGSVEVRGVGAATGDVEPKVARRPPVVTNLHCE